MNPDFNFMKFQPIISSGSPRPSGLVKDGGKITVTKVFDFAGEAVR